MGKSIPCAFVSDRIPFALHSSFFQFEGKQSITKHPKNFQKGWFEYNFKNKQRCDKVILGKGYSYNLWMADGLKEALFICRIPE